MVTNQMRSQLDMLVKKLSITNSCLTETDTAVLTALQLKVIDAGKDDCQSASFDGSIKKLVQGVGQFFKLFEINSRLTLSSS